MSLFVIADLHLSFGSDKPMDIFKGWKDHAERLKYNWQLLVSPSDTVVIPGDISWAMSLEQSLDDFRFIDSLNGRKIILKGNHDYWWSTVGKTERFFNQNGITSISILNNNCYAYENIGICGTRGWINENGEPSDQKVIAREAGRLERSVCDAERQGLVPIVFLHYPPVFMSGENKEILRVLEEHNIAECFYGHIHGAAKHAAAFKGKRGNVNYHLVSGDYLQFMPLDITKFVQNNK